MRTTGVVFLLLILASDQSCATEVAYSIGRFSITAERVMPANTRIVEDVPLSMLTLAVSIYLPVMTTAKQSGIGVDLGAGSAINLSTVNTYGLNYVDALLLYKHGTNANSESFTRFGYGAGVAARYVGILTKGSEFRVEDTFLNKVWPGLHAEISYEVWGLMRLRALYFFETTGINSSPGSGFELTLSIIPNYDS